MTDTEVETTERDLIAEALELAPYVQGIADSTCNGQLSRVPDLLRRMVDELKANRETLLALKNCQNKPVCGHCNALLRHATRNLGHA